jgi:protein TonB
MEQGTVVLSVVVSEQGSVSDISIFRSSGSERLDHAALRAVRRWRWSPTFRDGSAVLVQGLVKIPFLLRT